MKNANEIKAAWNTFKREAKKEISFDLSGCCYMNAKQIQNGTATITLCADTEYDEIISSYRTAIDRVNGYDTWTAKEKKERESYYLDAIEKCETEKATYGTKVNEVNAMTNEIINSAAFKKMTNVIGVHTYATELIKKDGMNVYQIRIHY